MEKVRIDIGKLSEREAIDAIYRELCALRDGLYRGTVPIDADSVMLSDGRSVEEAIKKIEKE